MKLATLRDTFGGWIALACAAAVFAFSVADLPRHAEPVGTVRSATLP